MYVTHWLAAVAAGIVKFPATLVMVPDELTSNRAHVRAARLAVLFGCR